MATMKMKHRMEKYCSVHGIKMEDHLPKENYAAMDEPGGTPNAWAVCHSSVGSKKTPKFERCVQDVKKREGLK